MLVAESSPQTELLVLVLVLILLPPDIEHSVHMETEWPTALTHFRLQIAEVAPCIRRYYVTTYST